MTALLRLLALAVLFVVPLGAAHAEGERPFRIYMALWRGWEEAAQGFEDYLVNHRVPHQLIVRDANQDASKLPDMVREAKTLRADLVFTWGTTVSLGMLGRHGEVDPQRHITDIPVVFGLVSNPEASGILPPDRLMRKNITGTRYLLPLSSQLKLIWSYRPFERLGLVYNPAEANSLAVVEELKALSATWDPGEGQPKGFALVARPLPLVNGLPVAAGIADEVRKVAAENVDFLYIPPDSFLNVNRDILTQAALTERLPTFAAAEAPVRKSKALFTGAFNYYTVGQLAAHKARQILEDRISPYLIPIDAPSKVSILLNVKTVHTLDFFPPLGLVGIAETLE